jgi:alpha,alpha-trehalose phosphorylase (configuration-retaining)
MSLMDHQYYMKMFRSLCSERKSPKLLFPQRDYIVQVARFDPSKGIPDVIRSYVKARVMLDDRIPGSKAPQLCLVGHGAVDDPDATIIYDQIMDMLEQDEFSPFASDIVVVRLPPSDECTFIPFKANIVLNSIMTNAKIALQLSLREGFEIKVSEALHKGIPVIATNAGGIPLQIQDGKSGFLVNVGDTTAVANHIVDLWTDKALYKRMSDFAKTTVTDEVSTVGSAASWLWMANKLAGGEKLRMKGQWVNDLMRQDTGEYYTEGEPRLPRKGIDLQGA